MQVTRQRVSGTPRGLMQHLSGRAKRPALISVLALLLTGTGLAYGSTAIFADHQVGTDYADGLQISSDQLIKPPLTPRAGLDMDDDPVLVGPVELLIQQAEELFVART